MALVSSASSCSGLWHFLAVRTLSGCVLKTSSRMRSCSTTLRLGGRTLSRVIEVDLVHVGIRTSVQPLVVIVPLLFQRGSARWSSWFLARIHTCNRYAVSTCPSSGSYLSFVWLMPGVEPQRAWRVHAQTLEEGLRLAATRMSVTERCVLAPS